MVCRVKPPVLPSVISYIQLNGLGTLATGCPPPPPPPNEKQPHFKPQTNIFDLKKKKKSISLLSENCRGIIITFAVTEAVGGIPFHSLISLKLEF